MDMNDEDVKFEQVTNLLKNLSKVKAPNDFETTLWRKINSANYQPQLQEERWWEKFLMPQRLIPAAAGTLAIIILFVVFTISTNDSENPLIAQPKLRTESKVAVNTPPVIPEVKTVPKIVAKAPKQVEPTETPEAVAEADDNMPGQLYTSSDNNENNGNNGFSTVSYGGNVTKSGYNFLQVRMSDQEKERINRLKARVHNYFNSQKK